MPISLNESDQWLMMNFSKIDEVLAILFLGRSGTVFLGSLLDDHPQIIMFPGTQLSFYEEFWEKYGKNAISKEILIRQFCSYFASFFDVYAFSPVMLGYQPSFDLGFDEMGSEKNETAEIDKIKFIFILSLILSDISQIDRKIFFQAIHVAYTITLNKSEQLDRNRLPIIVYALHQNSPVSVNNLCSDFTSAKMIHMIREPIQTMGSHFKHDQHYCHIMRNFFFDAFPKAGAERSKAIKLEDLHSDSHVTLKKLIQWIGVDWSNSLLESTYNGKKWWNVKDSQKLNGFNKTIISDNYRNVYSKFDLYRLKVLYAKRFIVWGYPNRNISRLERFLSLPLLFIPFRMELIDFKKNVSSQGLRGIKYEFFCWFDRIRRRSYLLAAWRYSFSKETKEVELL